MYPLAETVVQIQHSATPPLLSFSAACSRFSGIYRVADSPGP